VAVQAAVVQLQLLAEVALLGEEVGRAEELPVVVVEPVERRHCRAHVSHDVS
jgi:hypothetical protein